MTNVSVVFASVGANKCFEIQNLYFSQYKFFTHLKHLLRTKVNFGVLRKFFLEVAVIFSFKILSSESFFKKSLCSVLYDKHA